MKKLVVFTTLICSLPALATETAQEKTQRRCTVINSHIFPKEHKATFQTAAQQPSFSCIDCQAGETQSWTTPEISQLSHNTCAAQTIDLTKLPQPSQTASYIARLGEKAINDQCKILGLQHTISDKAEFIKAVAQKEHELAKTHYAFYHGTPKHVLVGLLFNTELARAFENWQEENFIKLRATHNFYSGKETMLEYLKGNMGKINDMQSPYQEHLLSTNLSFPGFMEHTGSSTFRYFLENHSASNMNNFLEKTGILASLPTIDPAIHTKLTGLIAQQTEKLSTLANKLSDTGILIQIFIPKTIVNECTYLAEALGGTQKWKMSTPTISKWDPKVNGYTDIADALEHYQNGCKVFNKNDLYRMQARLRLDNTLFNNPNSGIQFFIYHELPQQEFAKLTTDTKTLVKDFVANKEVQLLLQVYHECHNNPTDYDAFDNAITITEAALKCGKQTLLHHTAPHKELANYCQKNISHLNTEHITKLQALITRYPQLSNVKLKMSLNLLTNQSELPMNTFSPNSLRVATLSNNKDIVYIWNLNTGEKTHTLTYTSRVADIAFSPDGSKIAIALTNKTIEIWDLIANKKMHILPFPDLLLEVIFSPDGSKVATVSVTCAYLWDCMSGKKIHTFTHGSLLKKLTPSSIETVIKQFRFSPNGSKIATVSYAETVIIWDAKTGKKICNWCCIGFSHDITFSPNGSKIAIAYEDKTACIFDTTTGYKTRTIYHSDRVNSVAFNADGTHFATASNDTTAYIWNNTTEKNLTLNHADKINVVRFSADGSKVLTASNDNTACVWDAKTGSKLITLKHPDKVYKARFNDDSSKVFTCFGSNNTVLLWDIQNLTLGNLLSNIKTHNISSFVQGQKI